LENICGKRSRGREQDGKQRPADEDFRTSHDRSPQNKYARGPDSRSDFSEAQGRKLRDGGIAAAST
jgi:hypothetical protein